MGKCNCRRWGNVVDARQAFEEALRGLVSATGQSALTLVERWLAAADSMVALHDVMSVLPAPTGPSLHAARLLLADTRRQLVNEVELRPELPRDLVTVVFGASDSDAQAAG